MAEKTRKLNPQQMNMQMNNKMNNFKELTKPPDPFKFLIKRNLNMLGILI